MQVFTRSIERCSRTCRLTCYCCAVSKVDLGEVVNSFLALDMVSMPHLSGPTVADSIPTQVRGSAIISVDAMSTVLLEACAGLPNPASHVEVLLSWFLSMFDRLDLVELNLQLTRIGNTLAMLISAPLRLVSAPFLLHGWRRNIDVSEIETVLAVELQQPWPWPVVPVFQSLLVCRCVWSL